MKKKSATNKEKTQADFALSVSGKSEKEPLKLMGEGLNEIRRELKLSQNELGRIIGINQNIISRLEKGKSASSALISLLNFFLSKGYNINYILSKNKEDFSKKILKVAPSEENLGQYFEYIE